MLISPVITEKANTVAEKNEQVVFKVLKQTPKLRSKRLLKLPSTHKLKQYVY